jgi:ubiquinone/menaquinone biosynthesis C-methylase UbiE
MTAELRAQITQKNLSRKLIKTIYLRASIHTNSRVLEAGCRDGRYIGTLYDYNPCFCWGLDQKSELIKSGREGYPHVHFLEARVEKVYFPENFFDLVFSINVIGQLKKRKKFFKHALSVLRSKGACMHLLEVDQLTGVNKYLLRDRLKARSSLSLPALEKIKKEMEDAGYRHVVDKFLPIEFHYPQEEFFLYWIISGDRP